MWNVPNLLTFCRFLLIPVYAIVFMAGHPIAALLVLLVAGGTDVIDGYIARKYEMTT